MQIEPDTKEGAERSAARIDAAPATSRPPRIVIVGGGFGGLTAARRLTGAPADVIVIDRNNYHLFQPLLYQVATAALSPADIAAPIRVILRGQGNATVFMDEVLAIDAAARRLTMRDGKMEAFDYLVLATGSQYSYFGHDDWPRLAPGLKSIDDATLTRRRLLLAFEQAENCEDEAERRRLLTFVLVGAGPTGVEMAGALAELARAALARDFRHVNPAAARILLVEAGNRVLAEFPEKLSHYAERTLRRMGVDVLLDAPIEMIDESGVVAKGEHIPAATVLWCAGVQARPVCASLGAPTAKNGAVRVLPDLSVEGHPDIFVIGDAASCAGPRGKPLPGLAAVAEQQGVYVADLLFRRLTGRTPPPPFAYHDKGTLATIGRSAAVADFGRIRLTGWLAWMLWGLVHIFLLIGFRNRVMVFVNWTWAWLTNGRGARLITGETNRQR